MQDLFISWLFLSNLQDIHVIIERNKKKKRLHNKSFNLKYFYNKTLKIDISGLLWEHTTYHQHISRCCYSFGDKVLPWHLTLRPPHWSSSPTDTYSPPLALNLLSLPRLSHQISKQKSWDITNRFNRYLNKMKKLIFTYW